MFCNSQSSLPHSSHPTKDASPERAASQASRGAPPFPASRSPRAFSPSVLARALATQSENGSHQLTPAFPATRDSNLRKVRNLTPLFSISSALFSAFAHLTFPPNPFVFYRLRTFSDNYRGGSHLSSAVSKNWNLPGAMPSAKPRANGHASPPARYSAPSFPASSPATSHDSRAARISLHPCFLASLPPCRLGSHSLQSSLSRMRAPNENPHEN